MGGQPEEGGTPVMGGTPAADAGLPDMMPPVPDMGVEACTALGAFMEEFPCCEGASPVECSEFARNECIQCDALPRCLACGNGVCEDGENVCNCAADCNFGVECFEAGQRLPNVEGAPGCCGDLVPVGCDRAIPGGLCEPCIGFSTCSPCGNGVCDLDENNCNCPVDCEPIRQCQRTLECRQGDAPIDCGGVWRCDPGELFPSTERNADGCTYTCFEDLRGCVGDHDCFPGEVCRACPDGACDGNICVDPESL